MDILQLYNDFGVNYKTEGHKHTHIGWVHTPCPFCTGNPGYHLGYNLSEDYYICYRCGWHDPVSSLAGILKLNKSAVYPLVKQYGILAYISKPKSKIKLKKHPFKLPTNLEELSPKHRKYLERRNFDPDKLIKQWKLKGTGVFSHLEQLSYKWRIFIPFTWNGEVVSFDSRDITDKNSSKYMACPKERELVPHKEILYGDQEQWGSTGICVEGPSDVWRLGGASFATSGIKYTIKQLRIMKQAFKRVVVVFDDEPQAVLQGRKLVMELRAMNIDAAQESIKGDPGAMKQSEADYLVKQIVK